MFSKTKANKTYWFPDRPDIECFVITEFLDFDFNNDKDTEADRSHKLSLESNKFIANEARYARLRGGSPIAPCAIVPGTEKISNQCNIG